MRDLEIRPATSWDDVRTVFGPRGAYSGCWCMWFRLPGPEFRDTPADGRRERLQGLVEGSERAPGVLAYLSGAPVGWCAVAPREEHARLLRSPVVRPASPGEEGVWSVTCFYVRREGRGRGLPAALLEGAVEYAGSQGARVVEGYPKDSGKRVGAEELYYGWRALFEGAGFEEVERRSPTRPIMRRTLT
ncbi:GNAT family N-acetyltransferase [Nonomuraea sp. PA05]|uniref:GNAT family N-acetyltransferase n=1 Tax=Nonomuraea sp. PA05 TaxID=2604466 RepID=UPI0011D64A56|nr:GNAT family N-acetyltransferase [Nonomuraea sp. PA05]TYB56739.1 GNAT family N-acetyltransferase [Nonomuraea sp. PA05]